MRRQKLCLVTACIATACCAMLLLPAGHAAGNEYESTGSVTLVPMEPVPDADGAAGEVSVSDFDVAARSHAGYPIDVAARPISLEKPVSLKPVSNEKPAAMCDDVCDADMYGDCGCDGCFDSCCQPCRKHWVRADYLLWWTRGSRVPALVTTSTNQEDDGILGRETTEILYGNSRETSDARSAPRISMGYWFDCCKTRGIQIDYFNLGQYNNNFDRYSDGETLLARPFYSTVAFQDPIYGYVPEGQWRELVAKQGIVDGRSRVDADDYFQSWGVLGRWNLCCRQKCDCGDGLCCGPDECCDYGCDARHRGSLRYLFQNLKKPSGPTTYRVDFIAGYRNYRLDDNIAIIENLTAQNISPYIPEGTTFDVEDSFRTMNEFHGGELGLITNVRRGRWSLELLAKMALGNNSSTVSINGSTDIDRPGDEPVHYDEGLLALDTNSGRYHHDNFIVIPQFGIELGYDLTCCLRAYCGYNFIYWAQVARAAEQIDTDVNVSYVPGGGVTPRGEPAPTFTYRDSDFWAQGLNFGLEWNF